MAAADERLEVLRMIQSGRITAEEGARLLESLTRRSETARPVGQRRELQQVRICATDLATGRRTVDVRMPWNLLRIGIGMGARFGYNEIKLEELAEVIQSGAEGRVLEIVNEDGQERWEVFVE